MKLKVGDILEDYSNRGFTVTIERVTKTMAFSGGVHSYKFRRLLEQRQKGDDYVAHAIHYNKFMPCKWKLLKP